MSCRTIINGTEYELASTLRVAYKIQGQHNHKPYLEIFQNIDKMPIEQQIDIIYAALECSNPQAASSITRLGLLNYYLDNFTLKEVMNQLQGIIKGITGADDSELASTQGGTEEIDGSAKN